MDWVWVGFRSDEIGLGGGPMRATGVSGGVGGERFDRKVTTLAG